MKNKSTNKKQWKEIYISNKVVSTAVFEYLERKGIKVNRRAGCDPEEYSGRGRYVKVEKE